MSIWDGTADIGDRVVSTGEISTGWFSTIPAGRRGTVLSRSTSMMFGTTCTVEFQGLLNQTIAHDVPISKLRRTGGSSGALGSIFKVLLFISLLPTILSLGWFLIRGGSPADLANALLSELVTVLVSILAPLLPLVIIVGALALMMRGGRKTK